MSYGRDDKNGGIERGKFTNSGPKKAADSVHPGRPSIDSDCTVPVEKLEIDKKLLIDPKKLYIGSKIGEGAHGKVYEGKFGEQVVALKIINGGSTTEEKMTIQARFIREVNMMSKVKHENLVKVCSF
ncbi:Serine/threonine-protein kinase HT1 [Dendrobium catenatum]|uniref:Serine/threonine-protein kinase HT1 n=1 Tax=Dendrobium catenatum TaxID=906689 RepID=A0A2I0W4D4_9ASPA|nr:Serine/threonine-protein kinase HT1 [Dendrobium catenatum]